MLRMLQRIVLLDIELTVVHVMHDHVHASEVVGGAVKLLTIEVRNLVPLWHTQQQRARTTGGIVTDLSLVLPAITSLASILETCCGV